MSQRYELRKIAVTDVHGRTLWDVYDTVAKDWVASMPMPTHWKERAVECARFWNERTAHD